MATKKYKYLVADFETTTGDQRKPPKDRETEVWLSCFGDVDKYNNKDSFLVQYNIQNFFIALVNYCNLNNDGKDVVVFFHNLKFDGSFIANFLLSKNFEFNYFINNMGIWYSLSLQMDGYKIEFRDSHKILNFNLKTIAKIFKTPSPKGETPLLEEKPNIILPEWEDYVKTDVEILAHAIHAMYNDRGFTKFTSASQALHEFKKTKNYRRFFPLLSEDIDTYIRKAYKGGWTFVNPKYQGKIIDEKVHVYDIHSMYPSTMLDYAMPYGEPEFCEGEPNTKEYYVANVWLRLSLKDGYLPTLQTKDTVTALELGIRKSDYITTTNGEYFEFNLTNFDIDLIKKHYDHDIIYKSYYKFKATKGLFYEYIKKYKDLKENAKTPAEKQEAKIMLNALYGKFGAKIISISKILSLEDGVLKFEIGDEEEIKPQYIPLAVFITSISRHKIISSAQENYDIFLYADTDSLHLLTRRPVVLDVHDSKFGTWGFEGEFTRAKYLRAKLYIEEYIPKDYKSSKIFKHEKVYIKRKKVKTPKRLLVKGAGMTDEIKRQVNFNNFYIGKKFEGKKATKQVKGGMIIYDTEFTIKENGMFG